MAQRKVETRKIPESPDAATLKLRKSGGVAYEWDELAKPLPTRTLPRLIVLSRLRKILKSLKISSIST